MAAAGRRDLLQHKLGKSRIRPGIYGWTSGSGAGAGSFTLLAGAVPELSTRALSAFGLLAVPAPGFAAREKRMAATSGEPKPNMVG